MRNEKTAHRLLTATLLASLVVLTGCGASPTAPKLSKRTAAKPAATAPAAVPAAMAPAATHSTTIVPATPAALADTKRSTADSLAKTAESEALVAPESSHMKVGTQSVTSVEMLAESALSAETKDALDASLTAEISAQKNGVLLGIGTYKCTVDVTNNSDTERTGMLKLTFMNGSKESVSGPVLQLVTIPAHGSRSFDFEDKKWSTDSAVVDITPTNHGQSLAAFVLKKKNGVVLGIGTYKATIEVINPDDVERTGNLIVQFRNGSKDSKTPAIHQPITLAAHESKTFDFEDKKWSTNDVAVTVE